MTQGTEQTSFVAATQTPIKEIMNCPMDIIAKNIDSRVIGHALGTTRVPVHKFFNENIKGKGNTYKYKKIIEAW